MKNRYKQFKFGKVTLAFNTFPRTAKSMRGLGGYAHRTGLRYWDAYVSKNYAIVVGTFRIILSIDKPDVGECCG